MIAGPVRWVLVAVAAGGVTALAAQTPRLLRGLEVFRVDRVEVIGTRYLAAHEALAASGITASSSVFDDDRPWRSALTAHPMVTAVGIERRLPETIVIRITEAEPVALARTPDLRPVDGSARVLPIEPAAQSLDLPVLAAPSAVGDDGRLTDAAAVALVVAFDRIRRMEPAVAARVSEVHPAAGGGLRLLLSDPANAETLLPPDAGALRLRHLRLALDDLAARDELPRVRRIDLRFRDQVVVSMNSRNAS